MANAGADGHYCKDLKLAARCHAGDEGAVRELVTRSEGKLLAILVRRGAGESLAEDLLADMWADCFGATAGRAGLLLRYSGKSSLDTWLATVLTHRWLDHIRRGRKLTALDGARAVSVQAPPEPRPPESALVTLLRESLGNAFERCDAETFVMLQLVHIHGVSQREVAASWGISEFKICRQLSKAMRQIREDTLALLRARDPLLRLKWDDLVDICSVTDILGLRRSGREVTDGPLQGRELQAST